MNDLQVQQGAALNTHSLYTSLRYIPFHAGNSEHGSLSNMSSVCVIPDLETHPGGMPL